MRDPAIREANRRGCAYREGLAGARPDAAAPAQSRAAPADHEGTPRPPVAQGPKPTRLGEIVQIDTLFVNVRPDKPIKQITAYDPVARWTIGRVATSASARSAAALLDKLLLEAPFSVTGIQVDSGSEFQSEFEEACRDRGLALFVLPPKRPELIGAVERAQGSWQYEFYACFDLPHRLDKLQEHVDVFAHRFNHHRPTRLLADKPQPSTWYS